MRLMFAMLAALIPVSSRAFDGPPSGGLPRSAPEEQGVASPAVLAFVEAADQQIDTMNSFMLVRHGKVVAEGWWSPYNAESPHTLFSLSKSFTSTAVGLAIEEGKLSLDDEVLKFFPDDAPTEPSANLKSMRVHDLLRMSTGHQTEPRLFGSDSWTKTFLAHEVPNKPGTRFLYNTPATYMQSAIVQKVTGQTVHDYLKPRLLDPLGIEHSRWSTSPEGVSLGGYGLDVRTEDIAKFGQVYLQKGEWNGKQLIPAAWVEAATKLQTSNGSNPSSDWDQGYGYQFWRARHNGYRGDGAFGQYCIVLPDQDAVIAITSGVRDMQSVLNLVWDKLLPGLGSEALSADPGTHEKLAAKLASLEVRQPSGNSTSPIAEKVSGKRFVFPENERRLESVALEIGPDGATMVLQRAGREERIACGAGEWRKGTMRVGEGVVGRFSEGGEQPIAASGAWTADDTFTAKVCLYETPFYMTYSLKFEGEQVRLDAESNVAFGPTKQPQLTGKLAAE